MNISMCALYCSMETYSGHLVMWPSSLQAKYPHPEYEITVVGNQLVPYVCVLKLIQQRYQIKSSINDEVFTHQGSTNGYSHPATGDRWLEVQWCIIALLLHDFFFSIFIASIPLPCFSCSKCG